MQSKPIVFRYSRVFVWFAVALCVVLLAFAWGGYKLLLQGRRQEVLRMAPAIVLPPVWVFANCAVSYCYADRVLVRRQLGLKQAVCLDRLVSAVEETRYFYVGLWRTGDQILVLKDMDGGHVQINLSRFDALDLNRLISVLGPFVFAAGVDRSLQTFAYPPSPVAKPVPVPMAVRLRYGLRMVSRAFLFIVLPAMIVALLAVMWAIATHQPAFQ